MSRVMVLGSHPDDAEGGCGGLIRNLVYQGSEVKIACMTRGERGPKSNPPVKNARIRSEEARRAAGVLGVEVGFLGFTDGEVVADDETSRVVEEVIRTWEPDAVLAHWPIDSHTDHQASGTVALRSLVRGVSFELYFFEVMTGHQTMNFVPTHYVDIGESLEVKHEACRAHESQNPERFLAHHRLMERMRGREIGVEYAEAFVRASRSGADTMLPGLGNSMQVNR